MDKTLPQTTPLMTNARTVARTLVPRRVRNWFRSPRASAKWFWDEVKFFFGAREVIEMRPGWSITCHPAAYRCAYYAQKDDLEQAAELDGFIAQAREGMMLLDIGAHFGLFSLAALHYGGATAQAIAIDPSPLAARFLRIHARLNGFAERLQVVEASVSDHSGWQDMVAVGVLASGYYVSPAEDHPPRELSQTKAVKIDDLVAKSKVNPTHIKIDVEGNEAAVLRGGGEHLTLLPAPVLFLEVHNDIVRESGGDPNETLEILKTYGYEMFTSGGTQIRESEVLAQPLIRIIAMKTADLRSQHETNF